MGQMRAKGAVYLFESARKQKYTDRGVRKMLARYAAQAGPVTEAMISGRRTTSRVVREKPDGSALRAQILQAKNSR